MSHSDFIIRVVDISHLKHVITVYSKHNGFYINFEEYYSGKMGENEIILYRIDFASGNTISLQALTSFLSERGVHV